MPSSKGYCLVCGAALIFKNKRDVERKKFCNNRCKCSFIANLRITNMGSSTCVRCNKQYKKKSNNQKYCSYKCNTDDQVARSYKYLNNNKEAYIRHLMHKPERKHIPIEYILELYNKQSGKCALSGIELTFIKIPNGDKVHTNLSIDRIDSTKGYEIGNIQLVCAIVNIMKSTLSVAELRWWCAHIAGGV